MNEQQIIDLLREILAWCIAAMFGLVAIITGWFTFRQNRISDRQDAFDKYIASLERRAITKDEFQVALQEIRQDRREMHGENRRALLELQQLSEAHLSRIEKKLDDYETRDAHTRHSIANSVQNLMQQVAVLEVHHKIQTRQKDRAPE